MAIDFRIRDFLHPIGLWRLRRTFERTQWMSPQELDQVRLVWLRTTLQLAYRDVPYYRRLFRELGFDPRRVESVSEIRRLPVLGRETLAEKGRELLARGVSRSRAVVCRTSGTSGTPVELHFDRSANILEFVYYWRHWSWAGFRLGDRFAEIGSQFFLNRPEVGEDLFRWQPILRRLMLNAGRISASTARSMAEALRRYHPRFIKGLPSALYYLAYSFHDAGIRDVSFQAAFTTGEVVTPATRELVSRVFGAPLLDSYGHMERCVAISQCLEGSYHVHSDYGLLEVVEPRRTTDGELSLGRALGTSLHNRVMPLIRYDTGDDVELYPEPRNCPCGRRLPVVGRIHGRTEDTIVTPDGRFITSAFILTEFVKGVRSAQFVQETARSLDVLVVPDSDWNDQQKDRLEAVTRRLVGPRMEVRVAEVGPESLHRDPSGKTRVVLSRINNNSRNSKS